MLIRIGVRNMKSLFVPQPGTASAGINLRMLYLGTRTLNYFDVLNNLLSLRIMIGKLLKICKYWELTLPDLA